MLALLPLEARGTYGHFVNPLFEQEIHRAVHVRKPIASHYTVGELVTRIETIVLRNYASGRLDRVMRRGHIEDGTNNGEPLSSNSTRFSDTFIKRYIDRVVNIYLQEHQRVVRLALPDPAEWQQLMRLLVVRAYRTLVRLQHSSPRAQDEAADFAQQTSEIIFRTFFPFDIPFDAWATVILNNCILQSATRSADLLDRTPKPLSLDTVFTPDSQGSPRSLATLLAHPTSEQEFESVEVQEWLLNAIRLLPSDSQQYVILASFFYEMDDREIAHHINRSIGAVYTIRHRALKRLRELLQG